MAIQAPAHSGTAYHNYKGCFSIVVLAVVDSQFKFLYVDVGANGSCSNAGIFKDSEFYTALEERAATLPPPEPLPDDDHPVPCFFVADDVFALKDWMMKLYATRNMTKQERLFNYRLSRARRIVENAIGILAHRFRCLLTTMLQKPDNMETIVLACCYLHNLLATRKMETIIRRADTEETPADQCQMIPGSWRCEDALDSLQVAGGNVGTRSARAQRDYLRDYYTTTCKVSWQDKAIEVNKYRKRK